MVAEKTRPAAARPTKSAPSVLSAQRNDGAEEDWYTGRYGTTPVAFSDSATIEFPVKNSHPALQERGVAHSNIWQAQAAASGTQFLNGDFLSKWLVMLPQVAVRHFKLEVRDQRIERGA